MVADNGPGIPAEQMADLFSPFISTKKSRGTGLGPAGQPEDSPQARRQDCLSKSEPGQGCRFTLDLPATLPQDVTETIKQKGEG